MAMQHDWPDAVSAFLKKCPTCDINAIDEESGMPALHFAIINNRPNTAKVLLDAGADYNIRDGNVKQNNDYESAKGELPEDARTAAQRADRSGDTETEQLVEYIEGASARPEAWPPRAPALHVTPPLPSQRTRSQVASLTRRRSGATLRSSRRKAAPVSPR